MLDQLTKLIDVLLNSWRKFKCKRLIKAMLIPNLKILMKNIKKLVRSWHRNLTKCHLIYHLKKSIFTVTGGSKTPSIYQKQATHKRCKNIRSEEHTSELQSRGQLVCRHLLEKKKT